MARTSLEETINKFEGLLEEMRAETQVAHGVLRDIRAEKKEIDRVMKGDTVRKLVDERLQVVVRAELDRIGPEIKKLSHGVYKKVQEQADMIINICLGQELSNQKDKEDLRPMLAKQLKQWVLDTVASIGEPLVIVQKNGEGGVIGTQASTSKKQSSS